MISHASDCIHFITTFFVLHFTSLLTVLIRNYRRYVTNFINKISIIKWALTFDEFWLKVLTKLEVKQKDFQILCKKVLFFRYCAKNS